jgi:hypothetical protein
VVEVHDLSTSSATNHDQQHKAVRHGMHLPRGMHAPPSGMHHRWDMHLCVLLAQSQALKHKTLVKQDNAQDSPHMSQSAPDGQIGNSYGCMRYLRMSRELWRSQSNGCNASRHAWQVSACADACGHVHSQVL